jgi:hypothetical protein
MSAFIFFLSILSYASESEREGDIIKKKEEKRVIIEEGERCKGVKGEIVIFIFAEFVYLRFGG